MLLIGAALLLVPTFVVGYYAWFAWLVRRTETPAPAAAPRPIAVLIPAHNEQNTIAEAVLSVWQSDYPRELITVTVLADNCTDDTSAIARHHGATVLERFDSRNKGKGFALKLGLDTILQSPSVAVLILDADCQLLPDTLSELNRQLAAGHDAIQTAVHIRNGAIGPAALVAAIGGEVENHLSEGFQQAGRVVHLRGTGMIFTRELLERLPWNAFGLTEDAEYSETLRRAGVPVRFTSRAAITTDAPLNSQSLSQQRQRWRESLFVDRSRLLDRWLMSKPIVVAHFGLSALVALSVALSWGTWQDVALIGSGIAVLTLLWANIFRLALRPLQLPSSAYRNLLATPWILLRLAMVTLQGLFHRGGTWQRTARAEASAS